MADENFIIQQALAELTLRTDNERHVETVRSVLSNVHREILSSWGWNFARKATQPTEVGDGTSSRGADYILYRKPPDLLGNVVLRLVNYGPGKLTEEFEVDRDGIHVYRWWRTRDFRFIYTADIPVTEVPAYYERLLVLGCANRVSPTLNPARKDAVFALYNEQMREAQGTDRNQQDTTNFEIARGDELISSYFGGGSDGAGTGVVDRDSYYGFFPRGPYRR